MLYNWINDAIEIYCRTLGSYITYILAIGNIFLSTGKEEMPSRSSGKILALKHDLFRFSHVF